MTQVFLVDTTNKPRIMRFVCFFLPILLFENGDVSAVTENNLGRSQPKLWATTTTSTSTSDVVELFFVTTMEVVDQKHVPTRTKIQEADHQRQPEIQPATVDGLQLQTLPEETEHTYRQKKPLRHDDRTPADGMVKTTMTVENDVVHSRIHQPRKQRLRSERIRLVKTEEEFDHQRTPMGETVKNTMAVEEDAVANSRDRMLSTSSSPRMGVSIRFAWGVSAFIMAWSWFV